MKPTPKKGALKSSKPSTWFGVLKAWFAPQWAVEQNKRFCDYAEWDGVVKAIHKQDKRAVKMLVLSARYTELSLEILDGTRDLNHWRTRLELYTLKRALNALHNH